MPSASDNDNSRQKTTTRKPRPHRTGRPYKYDWDKAEELYTEGLVATDGSIRWPTLKEIGEQLGIPEVRVRERSAHHRWSQKKQTRQLEVQRERNLRQQQELAGQAVAFDKSTLDASKLGIGLVTQRLAEVVRASRGWEDRAQLARERRAQGLPVDPNELRSPVYHAELVNLAAALNTFQTVGMRALGTDVQRHEVSGPDGGPLQAAISVSQELERDDPNRLQKVLEAMHSAGLLEAALEEDEIVIEGEVVEEETA